MNAPKTLAALFRQKLVDCIKSALLDFAGDGKYLRSGLAFYEIDGEFEYRQFIGGPDILLRDDERYPPVYVIQSGTRLYSRPRRFVEGIADQLDYVADELAHERKSKDDFLRTIPGWLESCRPTSSDQ